ncbi:MAG: hypothetical protein O2895_03590 [Chloroflexi bacterium]|nr:hypothetical protein [Chloroflexota bacterium]
MATVTCNHAIWQHVELVRAEAEAWLPSGGTPLDNCDWSTTGPTSDHVASELRTHASGHGLNIDALKPDLRARMLAAIAG